MAAAATPSSAPLAIGELEATLADETLSAAFREQLRVLDGKAKAAPEVKGRFERYLDFVTELQSLYSMAESDAESARTRLAGPVRNEYFACPPQSRIAVASQAALKAMADHLRALSEDPSLPADLELTKPVFNDAYRKLQQKHDVWKKNYKPKMTLHALMCMLS